MNFGGFIHHHSVKFLHRRSRSRSLQWIHNMSGSLLSGSLHNLSGSLLLTDLLLADLRISVVLQTVFTLLAGLVGRVLARLVRVHLLLAQLLGQGLVLVCRLQVVVLPLATSSQGSIGHNTSRSESHTEHSQDEVDVEEL